MANKTIWDTLQCSPIDDPAVIADKFAGLVRDIARHGSSIANPFSVIRDACHDMLSGVAGATPVMARSFIFVSSARDNAEGVWWRIEETPSALTRDTCVSGAGWRFVPMDICYSSEARMYFVEGHWAFGFGEEYQRAPYWTWSTTIEHALASLREKKGVPRE